MKHLSHLLIPILITHILITQELSYTEPQQEKAVSLPREVALPLIAYQPECPIKPTYIELRNYLSGGGRQLVKLRNENEKPIKSFVIAHVASSGTSTELTIDDNFLDGLFMPGKEIVLGDPSRDQLVPITKEVRKELALPGDMQFVSVVVVVKVRFADGSIYDDEKTYNALKLHFRKISKCS